MHRVYYTVILVLLVPHPLPHTHMGTEGKKGGKGKDDNWPKFKVLSPWALVMTSGWIAANLKLTNTVTPSQLTHRPLCNKQPTHILWGESLFSFLKLTSIQKILPKNQSDRGLYDNDKTGRQQRLWYNKTFWKYLVWEMFFWQKNYFSEVNFN